MPNSSHPIIAVAENSFAGLDTIRRDFADTAEFRVGPLGTPDEVYERPNSKYVADFIGSPSMNFFEGTVEAAGVPRFVAEGISIDLSPGVGAKAGQKVILGVRPNDLGISDAGGIKGQVVLCETTGADMQVHLLNDGPVTIPLQMTA